MNKTKKTKRNKKRSSVHKKRKKSRRGTNLQKVLNIPGLSAEITKHLSIPNVEKFRSLSRKTRKDAYIKKNLKSRAFEFSNEVIDLMLQKIHFIKTIPNYNVYPIALNDFVTEYHFDDQADEDEMRDKYSDYDSDDEGLLFRYKVEKYRDDYIMIQHYVHPTTPKPKFIISCPRFKRTDLLTLNARSFSSSSGYSRFKKVFMKHLKDEEFRIFRLIDHYDTADGGYSRIKPHEFKKTFYMIP